ncbi:MAG: hypothetical protein QG639_441 [Patescibacteria group bacterium]|nr:hypothetical protein [Patescibacteria group bacterium]
MKKQKHVHVITKFFVPVAAGIETNILETYCVMVRNGWKVTLHTSRDSLTEKNVYNNNEIIEGIEVRRYKRGILGINPQIDLNTADVIALHNFDVVPHFQFMVRAIWHKLTGKKSYKLVLTPHGGFNPEWRVFSPTVAFVKRLYHYTLGVLLINACMDAVRAVSEWERREIASKGVKREILHVISNGIEDEAYYDLEKEASPEIKKMVKGLKPYVVQIGRIYPIKNYETSIRAISKIPNINYVIAGPVGDENYFTNIKKLAAELGMADRIHFVGVIRGADKYYLIKNAQLMVHMAIWESFCNVVHEGMSQGLVCVVANNTALTYLVKDQINGFLVDTYDVDTLYSTLKMVLEKHDSKEMKKIQETNRKFGLSTTWASTADKMDALYTSLIKTK